MNRFFVIARIASQCFASGFRKTDVPIYLYCLAATYTANASANPMKLDTYVVLEPQFRAGTTGHQLSGEAASDMHAQARFIRICLWLLDIEITHTATQGAAVQAKNFSCTVLATYFPFRLLQYPQDIFSFNRL